MGRAHKPARQKTGCAQKLTGKEKQIRNPLGITGGGRVAKKEQKKGWGMVRYMRD